MDFGYKKKSCGIQSFENDDLTAKSFVFKFNPLMNSGKIGDISFCTQNNKVGGFRNSIDHISVMVNFNYPESSFQIDKLPFENSASRTSPQKTFWMPKFLFLILKKNWT